ncbi:hypothetical protein G6L37_06030 [Agrobacterium rubi]|nr:hypothetical protein [Agrobacterium rubi]NTF24919.1 hypothetical protein [Agrobacterium rubi]
MRDILNGMLDRLERSQPPKGRWEKIEWDKLGTVSEAEALKAVLGDLAGSGAVELRHGRRGHRDSIEKVLILNPDPLYTLVGRSPSATAAALAIAPLRCRAEAWEAAILDEIESRWATNRQWQKIVRSGAEDLIDVQKISQAIRAGNHADTDFRTFSARIVSDSKRVERLESAVIAYMGGGGAGSFRDLMAMRGSRKITMPIMLSGPVSIRGISIGSVLDYVGVPVEDLHALEISDDIDYVLTIENLTSFHRHCVEINVLPRRGLVLFTSGQPSHAFKDFYSILVTKFRSVPFYHWSDLDGGGLEISKVMMDIAPALQPHLMTVEILRNHGTPTSRVLDSVKDFSGWLEPLARLLAQDTAMVLEQEVIDPALPGIT